MNENGQQSAFRPQIKQIERTGNARLNGTNYPNPLSEIRAKEEMGGGSQKSPCEKWPKRAMIFI